MSIDTLKAEIDAQLQMIEGLVSQNTGGGPINDQCALALGELLGVLSEMMSRLSVIDFGNDEMTDDFTNMAEALEEYQEDLGDEDEDEDDSAQES